jgi:hypothetical protein
MDALLTWLGLDHVSGPTGDDDRINVIVAVHGEFQPGIVRTLRELRCESTAAVTSKMCREWRNPL